MGVFFDLRPYVDLVPEVCQQKFNQTYSFSAIEEKLTDLRRGERPLGIEDIKLVFDSANTPFSRYWPVREWTQLAKKLREPFWVGPPPLKREILIGRMIETLGSLGAASVVLRFVHPAEFGVLSTPLMDFLRLNRPTPTALYLAYCDELREWQKHFRMRNMAETEMGLWVLHELTKDGAEDYRRRAFDNDLWVQRRRMAQAIGPFQGYIGLERAQLLAETDPNLAGQIAGREYERLLRVEAPALVERDKFWQAKGPVLGVWAGFLSSASTRLF